MNKPLDPQLLAGTETPHARWQREFDAGAGGEREVANVSGIAIRPLYTAADRDDAAADAQLGYPGQPDYTRGIYATMHRGRTWTQRQLVGLGTPADYNRRLLGLLERGATAVSLIPCNSVYSGYDMDSVEPELLGKEPTDPPVGPQGVGLSTGPVQTHHQLPPERLTQWMRVNQFLQLGHQVRAVTQAELRGDPALDHE